MNDFDSSNPNKKHTQNEEDYFNDINKEIEKNISSGIAEQTADLNKEEGTPIPPDHSEPADLD